MSNKITFGILAVISLAFGISQGPAPTSSSYIVQGASVDSVAAIVRSAGGEITHELGIIRSVGATLTAAQAAALEGQEGVYRIFADSAVEVAGKPDKGPDKDPGTSGNGVQETHYPTNVLADAAHYYGITGQGVGIAVLDTGLWKHDGIKNDTASNPRLDVVYNAITNDVASSPMSGDDPGGHGSHVASIAVSSLKTEMGIYNGIAPDAHLISVQAFDEFGNGTYADVVRAIDWVVANKATHSIRVLNLSFSAAVRSHYWEDPINQAVMAAWQKGIVVVAAAGNDGPTAMSIGVPGNVPYVITVGAMTDNYTPSDFSDDKLASFSAAGPTFEGFVKPDVVAPGGHMLGLMPGQSHLAETYPEFFAGDKYFEMSGTSQAAGVVSGIAALVIQANPGLSADDVKCTIMATARPATLTTGKGAKKTTTLAYSVFQQGAGLPNALDAVFTPTQGCANNGLDIDADVAGIRHFGGRANQDSSGDYFLMGDDLSSDNGYTWDNSFTSNGYLWTEGYLWTDGYLWTNGYLWTDGGVGTEGYLWTDGGLSVEGYLWTDGGVSIEGYLWTDAGTEMATMSHWVGQE